MTFAIVIYHPQDQPPSQTRMGVNAKVVADLVTRPNTGVHEAALFAARGGLTLEATEQGLVARHRDPRVWPVTGIIVLDCENQEEAVEAARRLDYAEGTVVEVRPALRLLEN